MITLITMTQGNPIALQRTVDNVVSQFNGLVDEVIIGNLCVFNEDTEAIKNQEYDCKFKRIINFEFNTLFNQGFAAVLNQLSEFSTNNLCLYLNVSEIVECNLNTDLISDQWNCYKFNHATETHKWIRLWNKTKLKWSGRIHEEIVGQKYVPEQMIFQMADTPKDNENTFYNSVMNDIKEMVYFNQYLKLIDNPDERGATNQGWIDYARDNYRHLQDRLNAKGLRYEAFKTGNLELYLNNCQDLEHFENNKLIHFQ